MRSNAPLFFMGEKTQVVNCHFEGIEWDVMSNGGSGLLFLVKHAKSVTARLQEPEILKGFAQLEPMQNHL